MDSGSFTLIIDAPRMLGGRGSGTLPSLIRPHKNEYWLTSKDKADLNFEQRMVSICDSFRQAIRPYDQQGIHAICIDEQTGIRALQRIAPDLPTLRENATFRNLAGTGSTHP